MRLCSTFAAAAIAAMLAATTAAQALPPLSENTRVRHEFLSAAIGDKIRKNCPTISARMWRVWTKARDLQNYAESLGYSDDDIDALRKDPDAKATLNRLRDDYLAEHGVTEGDAESYCRLGRAEIEAKSLTGYFLREN